MCTEFLFLWSVIHFIAPIALSLATSALFSNPIVVAVIALLILIIISIVIMWIIQKITTKLITIGKIVKWEYICQKICNFSLAEISIVLSVLSFALSVFYDYIYLNSLGISLVKSPIALGAYTLTTLTWVPIVVYCAIVSLVAVLLNMGLNPTIGQWSAYKLLATAILEFGLVYLPVWLFIFPRSLEIDDINNPELFLFFALAFGISSLLLHKLIDHHRIKAYPKYNRSEILSRFKFFAVLQIPFSIGFCTFLFCLIPKYAEISTDCYKNDKHSFTFANGDNVDGVLARNFETYFLIRNCKSGELEFMKVDRLKGPNWK